jgi:hypothetical protein
VELKKKTKRIYLKERKIIRWNLKEKKNEKKRSGLVGQPLNLHI